MSINGLTSYVWPQPFPSQSGVGATANNPPVAPAGTSGTTQGNTAAPWSSQNSPESGTGNVFQQLAADIQAVLVEGQGATATPAAATTGTSTAPSTSVASTTGGTATSDPADQLAADLQSIFAQMQSSQPAGDAGAQPPAAGQAAAAGQGQPHHHHHGGHAAAGASGGTGTGSISAATSTSSAAPAPGAPANSGIQSASQALAASVLQALQAYDSTTSSTLAPGLTA